MPSPSFDPRIPAATGIRRWISRRALLPVACVVFGATSAHGSETSVSIDNTLSRIALRLDHYARRIDDYFGDNQRFIEQANTRVTLSIKGLLQTVGGNETDYALRAKVSLPRVEKRLHLFFSKDSGSDGALGDNSDFFGPRGGLDSTSNLGLQYFFRDVEESNISMRIGAKIRGGSLHMFTGPRYRRTFEYGDWLGRFTQELLWHTDDGWESDTRLNFDRLLASRLLLRTNLRGLWLESNEDGYEYSLDFALDQTLASGRIVRYEWNNAFKSGVGGQLNETRVRVRYRHALWKKRLFGEIAPQLAFRDDEHFRASWGVELKLELVID